MRKTAIATLAGAALAITPVFAQTRTTDDYVCELAPEKCAEVEVPAEAAPSPATRGAPRTSATRGFTLARPKGQASASGAGATKTAAATTTKLKPVATSNTTDVKPRPGVGGTGQRVDLRLAFVTGSAVLDGVARAEAKVFADSLMRPELKGLKFVIEGHTDSVGGRDYNLDLSRRRAQAVADYLIGQGVSRDRLDVRGLGYDRPLQGLSAGAGANRRVEAVRAS